MSVAATTFLDFAVLFSHIKLYFAVPIPLFLSANMKIRRLRFNTYLFSLFACVFLAGCETTKEGRDKNKELTLMRFHLEVNPEGFDKTQTVPVFRENPTMVHINKAPFLDEGSIAQAALVDSPGGGYVISVQFNRHGTLLLDNVTTTFRGQRAVVLALFGETRWLGAPQITKRLTDGILTFTPDCTREEGERIVRGLNNVAKKLKDK